MIKSFTVLFLFFLMISQAFPQTARKDWEPLGPDGGSVRGIAIDPADGSVYAASYLGGIFCLRNGAMEWRNNGIDFSDFVPRASDVAINSWLQNDMLAAASRRVYYSRDMGQSWHASDLYAGNVLREVKFLNDTAAFAYDYESLYRSLDKGENWDFINLPVTGASIAGIEVDRARGRLFLFFGDSLFFSQDLGQTWTNVAVPGTQIRDLHVGPFSGKLYLLAGGIYRSADGSSWEDISAGAPTITWTIQEDVFSDTLLYLGASIGFYRWRESQQRWTIACDGIYTPQGGVNHYPTVRVIANHPNSQGRLYIGTQYEGIFSTEDAGDHWERIGVPASEMFAVKALPGADNKIIAGGARGVWLYENHSWQYTDLVWDLGGTTRRLVTKPDEHDVIFSAGQSGTMNDAKLNISTDGGLTWQSKTIQNGGRVWDYAFNPDHPDTGFAGLCPLNGNVSGLYRTTTGGGTPADWLAVANTGGFLIGGLAYSPADKSLYLAHMVDGLIYRTSDNGLSFYCMGVAAVPFEYYVTGLTFNSTGDKMYLYGPGVQVSENNGANWNMLGPEVNGMLLLVNDFVIDPANEAHFWVGTPTGLYESVDAGQSWSQLAPDLPVNWINSLALASDGQALYAATTGGSVFKITLTPAAGIDNEYPTMPQDLVLAQNFPNPFNPETKIEYTLPQAGPVVLKIYDALGQEVDVPVDACQTAGRHQVLFDASHLSSGIYFYTLKFGSQSLTRQMVLMK